MINASPTGFMATVARVDAWRAEVGSCSNSWPTVMDAERRKIRQRIALWCVQQQSQWVQMQVPGMTRCSPAEASNYDDIDVVSSAAADVMSTNTSVEVCASNSLVSPALMPLVLQTVNTSLRVNKYVKMKSFSNERPRIKRVEQINVVGNKTNCLQREG
jgi:hypothetical protein